MMNYLLINQKSALLLQSDVDIMLEETFNLCWTNLEPIKLQSDM